MVITHRVCKVLYRWTDAQVISIPSRQTATVPTWTAIHPSLRRIQGLSQPIHYWPIFQPAHHVSASTAHRRTESAWTSRGVKSKDDGDPSEPITRSHGGLETIGRIACRRCALVASHAPSLIVGYPHHARQHALYSSWALDAVQVVVDR